jgi:hypothetical protein
MASAVLRRWPLWTCGDGQVAEQMKRAKVHDDKKANAREKAKARQEAGEI